MKENLLIEVNELEVEELEERIAPSAVQVSSTGKSHGSTPEVPVGAHPQPNPIADYDVDCVTSFNLKQNQPVFQGERFSHVRYGSQVDWVVPLSARFDFAALQNTGDHVEAGIDPIIKVT